MKYSRKGIFKIASIWLYGSNVSFLLRKLKKAYISKKDYVLKKI